MPKSTTKPPKTEPDYLDKLLDQRRAQWATDESAQLRRLQSRTGHQPPPQLYRRASSEAAEEWDDEIGLFTKTLGKPQPKPQAKVTTEPPPQVNPAPQTAAPKSQRQGDFTMLVCLVVAIVVIVGAAAIQSYRHSPGTTQTLTTLSAPAAKSARVQATAEDHPLPKATTEPRPLPKQKPRPPAIPVPVDSERRGSIAGGASGMKNLEK